MEGLLRMASFLAFMLGSMLLFNIKPKEFLQELATLFVRKKQLSIKELVLTEQGKKKQSFFSRQIEEAEETLKLHKKEELFPVICGCSFILALAGMVFSFVAGNYFLAPVLFIGLGITPFIYVKFLSIQMTKNLNQELETALSVVTSSYIRSEDIVGAVEENLTYINSPVKSVFEQFVMEARMLNPDVKKLLREMKRKINNDIFQEWCDAVIACNRDSALKSTLQPIVKKLSTVRVVTVELDNMLYAPVKEHISMCLLVLMNVPLVYLLNKEWYEILVHTTAGKIALAVNVAVIFISSIAVIKISKPIEYKR